MCHLQKRAGALRVQGDRPRGNRGAVRMGRRRYDALQCCGGVRCVPALASAARWGEVQSLTPDWHGAGSAFMGEIQGRRLAGLLKAGRFAGASCVSGLLPLLPSLDARPSCLTRGMSAKSPRLCRLSPSGQGRSRSTGSAPEHIPCGLESDRVNVPANHGAQQAVGQRLSALPRDCSPTNL